MKHLSIYNAKNALSRVVADAEAGEPTMITRNGHDAAVVVSATEYKKIQTSRPTLVEFLLSGPLVGSELEITRSEDPGREPPDFS